MARLSEYTGRYAYKLIKADELDPLREQGYKAFDPHVHTSSSNDVFPSPRLSPAALYSKMDSDGFDYITFTDHDTLAGYDRLDGAEKDKAGSSQDRKDSQNGNSGQNSDGSRLEKLVKAVEIRIKPAFIKGHSKAHPHTLHNNVYNINQRQFEELEALAKKHDFYGFIDYCRKSSLPLTYNHPTWCEPQDMPDWSMLPDIIKEYDVIEVYNRGRVSQQNGLSLKLAERFGKGIVSSSDSHIGLPVKATFAKGGDFNECWEHVKAGESLVVPGSADYSIMREQVLGWIRSFLESNQEDIAKKGYNFGTGYKRIDGLINFLTGDDIEKKRVDKRVLPFLLKVGVYSIGRPIINAVYLANQREVAQDIEESLKQAEPKLMPQKG